MKNRLFLALFSLPFAGVGIGMLFFSIVPSLLEWQEMKSWRPLSAQILSADIKSNYDSDGGTTYEAIASYRYVINGRSYQNDRVAISTSADNIGDFQQNLGARLMRAKKQNQEIRIYVNPEDYSDSIISREMRWGLLAFKGVFVVVFGTVGVGLFLFAVFGKKDDEAVTVETLNSPWLRHKNWSSPVIYSGAQHGYKFMWGFAIFWCAISAPASFAIPGEIAKGNYGILVILLFDLVGLGLIWAAVKQTKEWMKFGKTPLTLDPYPGSIGGNVGGFIDVNVPLPADTSAKVTLNHIYSYVTGSGKNRSRSERVEWQDVHYCKAENLGDAARIPFRFDVPEGLHESEQSSNSYYKWNVQIEAEIPGIDLDRTFEIPVFATNQSSIQIKESATTHNEEQQVSTALAKMHWHEIKDQLHAGFSLNFPAGRNVSTGIFLTLFGLVFFGAGAFMGYESIESTRSEIMLGIMGLVFALVGGSCMLGGIYVVAKALSVTVIGSTVYIQRLIFGVIVKKHQIAFDQIEQFKIEQGMQSSQGNKHTIKYYIDLVDLHGKTYCVAEGFDSRTEAEQAKKLIEEKIPVAKK